MLQHGWIQYLNAELDNNQHAGTKKELPHTQMSSATSKHLMHDINVNLIIVQKSE